MADDRLQRAKAARQRMAGPSNKTTPGLTEPGTIMNLYNRPVTKDPAGPNGIQPGNWSTTYSKTFTSEDNPLLARFGAAYGPKAAVLLPTVVEGKFMTDDEAINRFLKTGEHLGIYDSWQNAEQPATDVHNSQQAMGNYYGRTSKQ